MLLDSGFIWVLILVSLIWFLLLTFWVYSIQNHYRKLVRHTGREDLRSILEGIITRQAQGDERLKELGNSLNALDRKNQDTIQKVGVLKFNPYGETGGNHSFAVSLLDGHNNGFVLLSLHSRDGTRVYIKSVKGGKSEYELSNEEKQAIANAE